MHRFLRSNQGLCIAKKKVESYLGFRFADTCIIMHTYINEACAEVPFACLVLLQAYSENSYRYMKQLINKEFLAKTWLKPTTLVSSQACVILSKNLCQLHSSLWLHKCGHANERGLGCVGSEQWCLYVGAGHTRLLSAWSDTCLAFFHQCTTMASI